MSGFLSFLISDNDVKPQFFYYDSLHMNKKSRFCIDAIL